MRNIINVIMGCLGGRLLSNLDGAVSMNTIVNCNFVSKHLSRLASKYRILIACLSQNNAILTLKGGDDKGDNQSVCRGMKIRVLGSGNWWPKI